MKLDGSSLVLNNTGAVSVLVSGVQHNALLATDSGLFVLKSEEVSADILELSPDVYKVLNVRGEKVHFHFPIPAIDLTLEWEDNALPHLEVSVKNKGYDRDISAVFQYVDVDKQLRDAVDEKSFSQNKLITFDDPTMIKLFMSDFTYLNIEILRAGPTAVIKTWFGDFM